MSAAAEIAPGAPTPGAPRQAGGSPRGGLLIIGAPIALALACFAAKYGLLPVGDAFRVGMIFALLVALMLTGMPISIALGLTVMTFLFTLTTVPMDSVALKLFTGIEKFEIMAIPFFILAGNFLTHGGVARRMINFATAMVGHDGHRGTMYYVSVDPDRQASGLGRALVAAAEDWLRSRGCWKINLLVRRGNEKVLGFYEALGYGLNTSQPLEKWIDASKRGD